MSQRKLKTYGYIEKLWHFESTPLWDQIFSKSPCYCAEIFGSSQRSLITASDEPKKSEKIWLYLKVMTLWKYAPLRSNFLKIPVLLCGDFWFITKVSNNCFRWAKENWKNMVIFKSYDTLKVRPFVKVRRFENKFSLNIHVIVQRFLVHHKGH